LLLFLGLVGTYLVYKSKAPYFVSTYSYLVKCDNGKEFDPTSKPIQANEKPYSFIPDPEFLRTFNEVQVKSECEYGTAYLIRPASELPKNYELLITDHKHPVGTKRNQLFKTVYFFVGYYVTLGIITEIIFYILIGRVFVPRKIKNICFKTKGL